MVSSQKLGVTSTLRIPARVLYGQVMSTMLGNLVSQFESGWMRNSNPDKTLRCVLGFPVPEWQRPLEWAPEQCERFIESVYTGVYLGVFVYNDSVTEMPELNGLLIDGQQRLNAIERYIAGDIAVGAPDGNRYTWLELTEYEKAHFNRMPFGFEVVRFKDEQKLKNLYNLLNFAGTPHKPSQWAT